MEDGGNMSRLQESTDKQDINTVPETGNRPDENLELSFKDNNSRMRRDLMEEAAYAAYDAIEHHRTFQKQQRAYDEVREQYEEKAYSSADVHVPRYVQTDPEKTAADQTEGRNITGTEGEPEETGTDKSGAGAAAYGQGDAAASVTFPISTDTGKMWKSPAMRSVEARESGGIHLGTAEASELAKNSRTIADNEHLQQRLDSRRKMIQKGYTRFSMGEYSAKDKVRLKYYGRLDLTGDADVHIGRLKYTGRITREKMTRQDYEERLGKRSRKAFKRRAKGRLLFRGLMTVAAADGEMLAEDDLAGGVKRSIKRTGRAAMMGTRRNIRTVKKQNNVYARLEQTKRRGQVLRDKRERLLADAEKKERRDKLRDAKSREQKKKLKKQMVQLRVQEEGNFFRRARQGILIRRRARKVRRQAVKRTMSTVFALAGLGTFFLIIGIILFLVLIAMFVGGSEYYASAVTQNDYGTITDATGYFRKLETDLDEYLNADREALEKELEAEYGPDIYEYVYRLADFGFSANTLIAYLSAVYGSFTLEDIQEELHSIFEEMYTLTIEVKEENRKVSQYNPDTGDYEDVTEPKKICYVILEKKELEEVVEARMTPGQLAQYKDYRLSTGGQQVYGPVMREDWTNLISSNFGERIHPITKERKVHNGVDIAVPIGTHLYSAVEGTVILAAYSESAGNWVKVRTDTGWTVIFMHMDSLTVSAGQQVMKGDHLGYSGNTGRSTGPHLHLEVRNPEDQPVNPIFIIPQTCAQRGGNEE